MSYRNPGQIQAPRTGQIFGQAIASFGQQVLSFAQTYAAQKERAAKEQEEENNRIQQIGYAIEEKAYENANKNYIDIQVKSPSLAEQFKTKTAELLNGVDGKIGAIEAQTELSTRTDLTKERRNELRNIVENAKAFQNRMIAAGGEITADLQGMENIRPQDIGNTHFYVGDTLQERLTSQFSAAILNNKEIPGALTNKILKSDENGMPIVSVSTVFDAESATGKKLLKDFPELKSNVKNGKISFNWERSVNQLGEGFIKEIPAGVDATQAFEDSGAMKDGRLTQQMMVGQPISKRFESGAEGRDNLVTTQYINTAGLEQDVTFNAQVEAKMDALISQDPGDIRAYMQNTLMLGSKYDYSSFMQQPAVKKKELLTKLEKERVIGLKLKGFSNRIATKEDAEYINNNAKALAADGKIAPVIPGETKIYFTEKIDQISSIAKTMKLTDAQRLGMTNDAVYQDIVSTVENIYNIENTDKRAELYVQNIKNIDPEADVVTVKTYLDNLAESEFTADDKEFRNLIERGEYTKAAKRQGLPTASGLISYKTVKGAKEKDTFIPLTGDETNVMKSMLSYMADISGFNKKQASTQYLKYKKQRKDMSPSGLPIIQPMGPN